ncbi:MAG: hypothetical protein ABI723_20815 [Bacteroidia bacterium]
MKLQKPLLSLATCMFTYLIINAQVNSSQEIITNLYGAFSKDSTLKKDFGCTQEYSKQLIFKNNFKK